ncbi:MAG: SDR family oxidoreductase [Tannerella sp.]|jgi:NAD(P)-dependent dehydrogenase (short-subunit alcohol dehydrogenase family)|nr:SDR family oxidoreductase [Tannerella sp.]
MNESFSIAGKVAVITGAAGTLGGSLARHFAGQGAKVVAVDLRADKLESTVVPELKKIGEAVGCYGNVLDPDSLKHTVDEVMQLYGRIDILLNIAGGNRPGATVNPEQNFFDMPPEEWENVTRLNLDGSVFPSMAVGRVMAGQHSGCIVNISSMAAYAALTRVCGYSVAKAGISNFTQWLAVEMAQKYGEGIRVNAIAPGFFIGEQNRALLLNPDGSLTGRSEKVLAKTPMGRFGHIDELNGAAQFLCSQAAAFVTGVVLPVDGGFSAFSGV